MTSICGIRLMVRRAANVTIHVIPDDAFEDWFVRDDGGHELGRFATREAAELVARAFARRRSGVLVVHLPDGRSQYESFEKGWLARWLAR
jgi:hypothetical protein